MSSQEFNTILTDVGGVLIKNYDTTDAVRQRVDLDEDTFGNAWPELIGRLGSGSISEEALWSSLADLGGKSVSTSPNFFEKTFADNLQKYDKVLSLLTSLGRHGYTLGVLSNTIQAHSNVLYNEKVYEPFDTNIFLSHEIHHRKPSPEAYEYALAKMNKQPEEVLFIDDREDNLLVPRELGMRTMLAIGGEDEIVTSLTSRIALNRNLS